MKTLLSSVSVAVMLGSGALVMYAQWPKYPTGVPQGPDGKANLTAPAPKMADGKPDLSGTWNLARAAGKGGAKGGDGKDGKGKDGAPVPPPPPPPVVASAAAVQDGPPVGQFFNIGAGLKDGLPPLLPAAAKLRADRKADNAKDNPDAHCLPIGLTQLHMHPQPRKIVQTDKVIIMMYEAQAETRQIFLDGRALPPKDAEPWWHGYSVGHWEGDTLVVETTGFRDDVWLDVEGSPLTNAGKMTERYRRVNFGTMQIDVTIEDPTAYSAPFTVRVNHTLMPDDDLIEFVCEERDSSHYVGKDGKK
jgi:hypothetical protein